MIELKNLDFPKGMNLNLLSECLGEQKLKELIVDNAYKSRLQRRIVLPSQKCLRKVIFHYLVQKYEGNYDLVMKDLKGKFKTLKMLDVSRQKVRELWAQRQKEIAKEKR